MDDEIQKKLAEIRRAENAQFKPITRVTGAGYVAPKAPTPPPIDWRFWRHMPEVKQWEACALSLNINPDHVKFDRQAAMGGPGNGPRLLRASFPSLEVHQEFEKRLRLLGANLLNSGYFTAVNNLVVGGRHLATLRLDQFAAWCLYVGLEDLPPELVAMGTLEPQAAPVATPGPTAAPIKKEGFVMKKAALVKKYSAVWPSIEADFNHASENGLTEAAKATSHGDWYESAFLAWGDQRGKRIAQPEHVAPNSIFNLAGTKHRNKD